MKLLSIETSCDDTCISILEMQGSFSTKGGSALGGKILANNSNSQIKIHVPFGGVYPVLAKKEHKKNLPILLEACLKEAKLKPVDPVRGREGSQRPSASNGVDAIAVTYGPGLEMCLWEGIIFAKELSEKWKVPLIPVNHMEGHIFSVFGKNKKFSIPEIKFPMLSLLVSGGHTQLVLIKKWMQYEIIGETLDDAVGEAFDKVARMLDLPYPGGPEISKLAELQRSILSKRTKKFKTLQERGLGSATARARGIFQQKNIRAESLQNFKFTLPRPMLKSKDFNFSFSGLKTAVLYLIKKLAPPNSDGVNKLDDKTKAEIALEFENSAVECLVYKTAKAVEQYKIKTLIVAGGVACNTHLQKEMKKVLRQGLKSKKATTKMGQVKLLFPTRELAGDNSLMIGIAGYLNYIKNKKKVPKMDTIKANGNLKL